MPTYWETSEAVTSDELLERVFEFYELNPRFHPVTIIFNQFNNRQNNLPICMTSFWDQFVGALIDLERSASEYNVLPYQGGLLDQPQYIIDAFKIIRINDAMYQREKMERDKSEAKASAAKQKSKTPLIRK